MIVIDAAPSSRSPKGEAVFVLAGSDHRFIGTGNVGMHVIVARPREASAS